MSQGLRWYCVFYKAEDHDGYKVLRDYSSHDCRLWIQGRGWQVLNVEEITEARAKEISFGAPLPARTSEITFGR